MAKPWYQTARRWLQINITEDVCQADHLEEWRAAWKQHAYQGVILSCGGSVCYYQSDFDYQRTAAHMGTQDIFGRFVAAARQDGLAVVARFDVQKAWLKYAQPHPEWFERNQDGSLRIASHDMACLCPNGPFYRDVIPQLLREVIEKYHPDGFSDNSWKGHNKLHICYCENCAARFLADTGLSLPQQADWKDPVYRRWIRWSYAQRVALWDRFDAAAHTYGGADCLWAGMFHADPMNRLHEFIDYHEIGRRLKILFLDHQCRDDCNGYDMEQNSMNGSLYHLLAPDDIIIPECTSTYPRLSGTARWFRLGCAPRTETRMWMREGILGGLSPWVHYMGVETHDRRRFDLVSDLVDWQQENEPYLRNRQELADVGVLWSQQNSDFYGQNRAYEMVGQPWVGIRHALLQARIPFLPIHTSDIDRHGHRVKTLILPEISVLSDEEENAILRFVQRGGHLVILGRFAMQDENGDEKTHSPLRDALGISVLGEEGVIPDASTIPDYRRQASYLQIEQPEHPLFQGFEGCQWMPFGGQIQKIASSGPLQKLMSYVWGVPLICEFAYPTEPVTDMGGLYAGTLPSGARIVCFAADIDRCYGRDELPDHRMLMTNAVRWTLQDQPMIQISGPGIVNAKLYAQEDGYILHLNNLTGAHIQPGYAEADCPAGPLDIHLNLPDAVPGLAQLRVACGDLPAEKKALGVHLHLDRLIEHEMILISREKA